MCWPDTRARIRAVASVLGATCCLLLAGCGGGGAGGGEDAGKFGAGPTGSSSTGFSALEAYSEAEAALVAGNAPLARAGFQEILADFPGDALLPAAQVGLGDADALAGDFLAAREDYAAVKVAYPGSDQVAVAAVKGADTFVLEYEALSSQSDLKIDGPESVEEQTALQAALDAYEAIVGTPPAPMASSDAAPEALRLARTPMHWASATAQVYDSLSHALVPTSELVGAAGIHKRAGDTALTLGQQDNAQARLAVAHLALVPTSAARIDQALALDQLGDSLGAEANYRMALIAPASAGFASADSPTRLAQSSGPALLGTSRLGPSPRRGSRGVGRSRLASLAPASSGGGPLGNVSDVVLVFRKKPPLGDDPDQRDNANLGLGLLALFESGGPPATARAFFDAVLALPQRRVADAARYYRGRTFDLEGNDAAALIEYQRLLAETPTSPFRHAARLGIADILLAGVSNDLSQEVAQADSLEFLVEAAQGALTLADGRRFSRERSDALTFIQKAQQDGVPLPALPALTGDLVPGVVGIPYGPVTLGSSDGTPPFTFSVSQGGLPPGLTLDPATGIVSGSPTVPGPFVFSVRVRDSELSATESELALPVSTLRFTNPRHLPLLDPASRNYPLRLNVVGGHLPCVITVAGGTLPEGFTLGTDGMLGPTPGVSTTAAEYRFYARAIDGQGNRQLGYFVIPAEPPAGLALSSPVTPLAAPSVGPASGGQAGLAGLSLSAPTVTITTAPDPTYFQSDFEDGALAQVGWTISGGLPPYSSRYTLTGPSQPGGEVDVGTETQVTPFVSLVPGTYTFSVSVVDAAEARSAPDTRTFIVQPGQGSRPRLRILNNLPSLITPTIAASTAVPGFEFRVAGGTAPYSFTYQFDTPGGSGTPLPLPPPCANPFTVFPLGCAGGYPGVLGPYALKVMAADSAGAVAVPAEYRFARVSSNAQTLPTSFPLSGFPGPLGSPVAFTTTTTGGHALILFRGGGGSAGLGQADFDASGTIANPQVLQAFGSLHLVGMAVAPGDPAAAPAFLRTDDGQVIALASLSAGATTAPVDLGGERALDLSVSPQGGSLAVVTNVGLRLHSLPTTALVEEHRLGPAGRPVASLLSGAPDLTGLVAMGGHRVVASNNLTQAQVWVLDTATHAFFVVSLHSPPTRVRMTPDGRLAAVLCTLSSEVHLLNLDSGVVTLLRTDENPSDAAFTADGRFLLVVCHGNDLVRVIDTTRGAQVSSREVGAEPLEIAIAPSGPARALVGRSGLSRLKANTRKTQDIALLDLSTLPWIPRPVSLQSGRIAAHVGFSADGLAVASLSLGSNALFVQSLATPPPVRPVLVPAKLPNARVGVPFTQPIALDGATPHTAVLAVAGIPAGLSFVSGQAGGILSGTPLASGVYTISLALRELNSGHLQDLSDVRFLSLYVAPASTAGLTILDQNLPRGTVGTGYSARISAVGGTLPYNFSVSGGSLPAGLTLSPDGTLSGVITQPGVFLPSIALADAAGESATKNLPLDVPDQPSQVSASQVTPIPDDGRSELDSTLNVLGSGVAGTLKVHVRIAHPFRGDLSIRLVAPNGASALLQAPQELDSSADIDTIYPDFTAPAESLAVFSRTPRAGPWTLRIKDVSPGDQGSLLGWDLEFTSDLVAVTQALPTARVGSPYSRAIKVEGGSGTIDGGFVSRDSLPPGLGLTLLQNPTLVVLSGTPTTPGTYTPVITFQDSGAGTLLDDQFTLEVVDVNPPPTAWRTLFTVPMPSPRVMARGPETGLLYVTAAHGFTGRGEVVVVDPQSGHVLQTVATSSFSGDPAWVGLPSDERGFFVSTGQDALDSGSAVSFWPNGGGDPSVGGASAIDQTSAPELLQAWGILPDMSALIVPTRDCGPQVYSLLQAGFVAQTVHPESGIVDSAVFSPDATHLYTLACSHLFGSCRAGLPETQCSATVTSVCTSTILESGVLTAFAAGDLQQPGALVRQGRIVELSSSADVLGTTAPLLAAGSLGLAISPDGTMLYVRGGPAIPPLNFAQPDVIDTAQYLQLSKIYAIPAASIPTTDVTVRFSDLPGALSIPVGIRSGGRTLSTYQGSLAITSDGRYLACSVGVAPQFFDSPADGVAVIDLRPTSGPPAVVSMASLGGPASDIEWSLDDQRLYVTVESADKLVILGR